MDGDTWWLGCEVCACYCAVARAKQINHSGHLSGLAGEVIMLRLEPCCAPMTQLTPLVEEIEMK
jgi:hypothetical protein